MQLQQFRMMYLVSLRAVAAAERQSLSWSCNRIFIRDGTAALAAQDYHFFATEPCNVALLACKLIVDAPFPCVFVILGCIRPNLRGDTHMI